MIEGIINAIIELNRFVKDYFSKSVKKGFRMKRDPIVNVYTYIPAIDRRYLIKNQRRF